MITKEQISDLLISWERFKKENWWESESIDVEKSLIDKYALICSHTKKWAIAQQPYSKEDMENFGMFCLKFYSVTQQKVIIGEHLKIRETTIEQLLKEWEEQQ